MEIFILGMTVGIALALLLEVIVLRAILQQHLRGPTRRREEPVRPEARCEDAPIQPEWVLKA